MCGVRAGARLVTRLDRSSGARRSAPDGFSRLSAPSDCRRPGQGRAHRMAAQWIIDMQHALVRCLTDPLGDLQRSISKPHHGFRSSAAEEAQAAIVEADVLRVRAEVAALDAAALRKSLRRTQNVAASTLFDVRQRATMKVCFHAIVAEGAQRMAEHARAGKPQPVWPFGPASATPSRRNRQQEQVQHQRLQHQRLQQQEEHPVAAPGDSCGNGGCGGALGGAIGQVAPHDCACGKELVTTAAAASMTPTVVATPPSTETADRSIASGIEPCGSRPTPSDGGTPDGCSWQSRATATALELAEAEELHDAHINALVGMLNKAHGRLAHAMARLRASHYMRLSLQAMRAYAAERVAFRGRRMHTALTRTLSNRLLLRASLTAWRLYALRTSELKQQRR